MFDELLEGRLLSVNIFIGKKQMKNFINPSFIILIGGIALVVGAF